MEFSEPKKSACNVGSKMPPEVVTAVGPSSTEVLATIEALRGLEEVATVETWTHFNLVKEDYTRAIGRVVGG